MRCRVPPYTGFLPVPVDVGTAVSVVVLVGVIFVVVVEAASVVRNYWA